MDYEPSAVKRLILDSLPFDFWAGLRPKMSDCYQRAEEMCLGTWPDAERRSLQPQIRRGNAEWTIREFAKSMGVHAEARRNKSGPYSHTIIHGDGISYTIARVASENQMVRSAVHRSNYASFDVQPDMFLPPEPAPPKQNKFAILIHGSDENNPGVCGFVRIAVPDRLLDEYVFNIPIESLLLGQESGRDSKREEVAKPKTTIKRISDDQSGSKG